LDPENGKLAAIPSGDGFTPGTSPLAKAPISDSKPAPTTKSSDGTPQKQSDPALNSQALIEKLNEAAASKPDLISEQFVIVEVALPSLWPSDSSHRYPYFSRPLTRRA